MKISWFRLLLVVFAVALLGAWLSQTVLKPTPEVALQPETIPLARLEVRDQRLFRPASKIPFTGIVVEFYQNQALKSRAQVLDGKLDGLSEGWHTNGVLQVSEHFKQGVSNGQRMKWYANGTKASECEIVDGKLNGTFRRWNEDGKLAEEIEMKNGEPHGVSMAFYPSGFVKTRARMQRGAVVEQNSWKDGEEKP